MIPLTGKASAHDGPVGRHHKQVVAFKRCPRRRARQRRRSGRFSVRTPRERAVHFNEAVAAGGGAGRAGVVHGAGRREGIAVPECADAAVRAVRDPRLRIHLPCTPQPHLSSAIGTRGSLIL